MKNIIFKSLAVAAAAVLVFGCNSGKKKAEAEAAAEQARLDSIAAAQQAQRVKDAEAIIATLPEEPVFDIITNMGTIKVKLYSDTPKHRENFEKLALTGFYDSLLFHRVINQFMIQGGDPLTRDTSAAAVAQYGTGGPGYTIPAEILPNHKHKKGALCAARRGDTANPMRESSGSQFYLVQDENTCAQLDGDYTIFGEAVQGLDVIDRIAKVATDAKGLPKIEVRIRKVVLDGETSNLGTASKQPGAHTVEKADGTTKNLNGAPIKEVTPEEAMKQITPIKQQPK